MTKDPLKVVEQESTKDRNEREAHQRAEKAEKERAGSFDAESDKVGEEAPAEGFKKDQADKGSL